MSLDHTVATNASVARVARPGRAGRGGRALTEAEREARQYRRLVAASLVLFLVVATLGRMTGWRWQPWSPGPDGYGSIVGEATQAARTYVAWAFVR